MARQNLKNTRKNHVVKAKVNKNISKNMKKVKKPNFFEEHKNSEKKQKNTKTVDNSSDKIARKDSKKVSPIVNEEKIKDTHIVTHLDQKVKVLKDISTVDGTLHKDEIVTVEAMTAMEDKNLKVIDNVGRFWYINSNDISTKL